MTEKTEAQAVLDLAESYYRAMVSGDAAGLRGLFDARAPIAGHYEGSFLWVTVEEFISEAVSLVEQHGPERCRIESLRIDGDIGFVAVGGQYAQAWLVDHLLVVRVSVGWKIAAKTFHVAT